MTFGREKRLLLGWMALLAPIPLPFNLVVSWPFFAAYEIAITLFLIRAARDPERWLPAWAMNVLGLAYIPLFLVDLTSVLRGALLRPLVHLIMFTLTVKLFSMRREGDKWHATLGVFFLFLAAMGTSVNPAVGLYVLVFLALGVLLLSRFALFHLLEGLAGDPERQPRPRMGRALVFMAILSVSLAVPLFPLLPRIRSPYLVGTGVGSTGGGTSTGFTDQLTLDLIGRIRTSSEVAMRLKYEGVPPPRHELRYKASTYDRYRGRGWERSRLQPGGVRAREDGTYRLLAAEPVSWVKVWLQPLGSASLVLPLEAVRLDLGALGPPFLAVDSGGAVALPAEPRGTLEYRVGMAAERLTGALAPRPDSDADPTLEQEGVSPRLAELAATLAGEGTDAEKAARIEARLASDYEYTLEFVGRGGRQPIDDFLFRYRSGHCEYFATAMALMLRSQGIPARLATGFLGGDFNPLEGYFIVRQSNAHAWVEAFVDGEGWRTYDPTPVAGRPAIERAGISELAQQAYDYLLFRWDLYVLTYGLGDQLKLLAGLGEVWSGLWQGVQSAFWHRTVDPARPAPEVPAADSQPDSTVPDEDLGLLWWAPMILLVVGMAIWLWRQRQPWTATRAYSLLRRQAQRRGVSVGASTAPVELRDRVRRTWPAAAPAADRVVASYLAESFAGVPLSHHDLQALHTCLREVDRHTRRSG